MVWDGTQPKLALAFSYAQRLRLSRFKLAGPPTLRDTEVSNAYAIIHDSLGPVYICSLIGINSSDSPVFAWLFRSASHGSPPGQQVSSDDETRWG